MPRSLRIKTTSICEVIRASMHRKQTGWQWGVRSCIMPGLPTHLVQELHVATVYLLVPPQTLYNLSAASVKQGACAVATP